MSLPTFVNKSYIVDNFSLLNLLTAQNNISKVMAAILKDYRKFQLVKENKINLYISRK